MFLAHSHVSWCVNRLSCQICTMYLQLLCLERRSLIEVLHPTRRFIHLPKILYIRRITRDGSRCKALTAGRGRTNVLSFCPELKSNVARCFKQTHITDTSFLCDHKSCRMCSHRGRNGSSPYKGSLFNHTTPFLTKALKPCLLQIVQKAFVTKMTFWT